jgi:hypothetical protein
VTVDDLLIDVQIADIDATSIRRKEVVRLKAAIVMRLKHELLDTVTALLFSLSWFLGLGGTKKQAF